MHVAGGAQGDADGGGDEDLVPAEVERRGQLRPDAGGGAAGFRRLLQLLEQDGELVAAQARDGVSRPHAAFEAARHLDQQQVALQVAEAVVDHLEAVEIQEHHGQPVVVVALRPRQRRAQPVHEQRAVGQTGERVVERLVRQPFLDALALGDVGADRGGADDLAVQAAQHGVAP